MVTADFKTAGATTALRVSKAKPIKPALKKKPLFSNFVAKTPVK